ncbi:MAG TPA: BamA/TamA family outer membrane protein [Chryseolinea sp.]
MARLILIGLILAQCLHTSAQISDSTDMDIVDLLFAKKKRKAADEYRSNKKFHFALLPAAVNVPGGGKAVITAINATFYAGDPTVTNLSNVYLIPYTNFVDRYGLYLRPNIWFPQNKFNLIADWRIAHFPQYSWGLGGDTPEWERSLIDSDYLRLYQTGLFKVFKSWFAGIGYYFDHHYNIEETEFVSEGHLSRYGETVSTTTASGFTINVVYDSRTNAINPLRGSYLNLSLRRNEEWLGSTYFNSSLFIDGRKYIRLSRSYDHILALRSYYWTVLQGQTPYLDLPATNWAPTTGISSRGFQTGRYRSNAMVYIEAEQRYQLTTNGLLGLVAFLNISSASEFDTQHFKAWQAAGGFGVRIKMNKYSDANIAVDMGFSHNYWGVWLNIGEMF